MLYASWPYVVAIKDVSKCRKSCGPYDFTEHCKVNLVFWNQKLNRCVTFNKRLLISHDYNNPFYRAIHANVWNPTMFSLMEYEQFVDPQCNVYSKGKMRKLFQRFVDRGITPAILRYDEDGNITVLAQKDRKIREIVFCRCCGRTLWKTKAFKVPDSTFEISHVLGTRCYIAHTNDRDIVIYDFDTESVLTVKDKPPIEIKEILDGRSLISGFTGVTVVPYHQNKYFLLHMIQNLYWNDEGKYPEYKTYLYIQNLEKSDGYVVQVEDDTGLIFIDDNKQIYKLLYFHPHYLGYRGLFYFDRDFAISHFGSIRHSIAYNLDHDTFQVLTHPVTMIHLFSLLNNPASDNGIQRAQAYYKLEAVS